MPPTPVRLPTPPLRRHPHRSERRDRHPQIPPRNPRDLRLRHIHDLQPDTPDRHSDASGGRGAAPNPGTTSESRGEQGRAGGLLTAQHSRAHRPGKPAQATPLLGRLRRARTGTYGAPDAALSPRGAPRGDHQPHSLDARSSSTPRGDRPAAEAVRHALRSTPIRVDPTRQADPQNGPQADPDRHIRTGPPARPSPRQRVDRRPTRLTCPDRSDRSTHHEQR